MTPSLKKLIEEKMAVLRGIYAPGMSAVALNALLYEFEDFAEDIALKAQEELREEIRKEIGSLKVTISLGAEADDFIVPFQYIRRDDALSLPSLSPQPAENKNTNS